ncbi:MAG: hypothetical protein M3413_09190, partial [Bacteroidota bacterium]|nr:hypothetical protein [Bacteroidota bacterium]
LKEWQKPDIDSIGFFAVTNDSSYVFPLTNYQSGLLETRTAGDNNLVSEVTRQGDYKFLYRLRIDENALRRRNVTAKPTEYMRKLQTQARLSSGDASINETDSAGRSTDVFQTEFDDTSDSQLGRVFEGNQINVEPIIRSAKVYEYRPPKFFNDYLVAGLNNTVFGVSRYQPYTGSGPIKPSNGSTLNGMLRMGTVDLFEDFKISGGFRMASNLRDNDILFEATNLRKRVDLGFTYYRSNNTLGAIINTGQQLLVKQFSNYYLARVGYAFDRVRSLRLTVGPRFDRFVFVPDNFVGPNSLKIEDSKQTFGQMTMEYVHDNTVNPTLNIWKGLRYKAYVDWFTQVNKVRQTDGRYLFNAGFDARHYLPIYRNVIWAVRGAGDFSWGSQKVIYYLGGVDGWLMLRENEKSNSMGQPTGDFRYFNPANPPAPGAAYAYQALAVNMRGFKQNLANGNNALVINSEVRMPVFATLLNRPINNALLRNFQLVQFVDLGTAWNGTYNKIQRPSTSYGTGNVLVKLKAGGVGPFAGGYGFGARSTLLGYFIRFDAAWEMNGFFQGKPQMYLALGLDF